MIAVLADIHGNLWALQAVLEDLDRLDPSQVIVAGDHAFGGPRPAECIELIRRRGYPAIRGNTDEWLTADPSAHEELAGLAKERTKPITDAIGWIHGHLSEADRRYLASLAFLWRVSHHVGDLVVVHATPWSISDIIPPDASESLVARLFSESGAAALVYGHIHVAFVRQVDRKVLLNPGSVGMPFDGDQRVSYGVLTAETGGWQAELRRVPYDVETVMRASRSSGNPEGDRFAQRIERAAP